MIKGNCKILNRFMGIVLSVLLISMPALAQIELDEKQPTNTLTDDKRGAIDGKIAAYESAKANYSLIFGCLVVEFEVAIVSSLIMKENEWYNGPTGCEIGMLAGALFGLVGFIDFSGGPPLSPCIGKSSEYVAAYQKAFRRAFKKEQLKRYYSSYLLAAVPVYLYEKLFQASMEH